MNCFITNVFEGGFLLIEQKHQFHFHEGFLLYSTLIILWETESITKRCTGYRYRKRNNQHTCNIEKNKLQTHYGESKLVKKRTDPGQMV